MRHPCTHAKSISLSIFASKTAVTSPATKLRTRVKITCTCIFASKTFGSSPSENRYQTPVPWVALPIADAVHVPWVAAPTAGAGPGPPRPSVGGARDRRGARGGGPAG